MVWTGWNGARRRGSGCNGMGTASRPRPVSKPTPHAIEMDGMEQDETDRTGTRWVGRRTKPKPRPTVPLGIGMWMTCNLVPRPKPTPMDGTGIGLDGMGRRPALSHLHSRIGGGPCHCSSTNGALTDGGPPELCRKGRRPGQSM